ncbi:cyclin H [Acrasis kona]|uniref:Cyclin H n=1 Tax=Acrasis kona TaxID=1008807 RepID=A0AAW2Z5C3_9EUKA
MSFTSSTQFRYWMFEPEKLRELNTYINKVTKERLHSICSAASGTSYNTTKSHNHTLTIEEEKYVLNSRIVQIKGICDTMGYPPHVYATAAVFFKRLLLIHSTLEFDLLKVALTCIYMSCKVEDVQNKLCVFLDRIERNFRIGVKPHEILKMELILLEKLQFQIMVHHPFKALCNFIDDADFASSLRKNSVGDVYLESVSVFFQSLLTDSCFLFSPDLVALACLYYCNVEDKPIIQRYILIQMGYQCDVEVINAINTIGSMLQKSQMDTVEVARIEYDYNNLRSVFKVHQEQIDFERKEVFDRLEQERRAKKTNIRHLKEKEDLIRLFYDNN